MELLYHISRISVASSSATDTMSDKADHCLYKYSRLLYRTELLSGMLNSVPFLAGLQFWDTSLHKSQNWHNSCVCSTSDTTVMTWHFEGQTDVMIYKQQLSGKQKEKSKILYSGNNMMLMHKNYDSRFCSRNINSTI
jgi:hypothetical protein